MCILKFYFMYSFSRLVSPSGTSPFPSLEETGVQGTAASQTEVSNNLTTEPKAEASVLDFSCVFQLYL